MAQKVHVLVSVDPDHETIIKPFAAQLAKPVTLQGEGHHPDITGTATATFANGKADGDGNVDF